jgi:lysophospholipase L1-like esterase
MNSYEPDVRELESHTAKHVNTTRPPVFYGSSSIRLWDTLAKDLDPRILNLGFGGSTLEACDYFFERLIPPVHPRLLVVYAGDNDLGDGRSAEQVLGWFRSLAAKVETYLNATPFGYISVKPSPARFAIIDRIRALNHLIRSDIKARKSAFYVDVFSAMLDLSGKPRKNLYLEDGLHMSRNGYKLWGRLLEPYRNQLA